MPVVMIDIGFGLLVATIGVVVGWFLRGRDGSRPDSSIESETRFAREVLTRLQNVAADVAAGVGEHTSRVEEINEELTASGDQEASVVVSAVDSLLKANARMQEQLESADEKLQDQARQIETHAAEARTDALTGLANRRAFDNLMAQRMAEFRRHGRGISILMMDVDHFKGVNDTHGHQFGDEVLRDLGKILSRTAREADTVARYGGEEFAVILPSTSDREAAEGAERFRQAIESHPFRFAGTDVRVTASFGVAELKKDEDATALIERSDAALYAAKASGRNCVFWSDGHDIHPLREDMKSPTVEPPAEPDPAEIDSAEIDPAEIDPAQDPPEATAAEATAAELAEPEVIEPRAVADTPTASTAAALSEKNSPSRWSDQVDVRQAPEHNNDGTCDRMALHRFLEGQLRRYGHGPDRPSVVLVQVDDHADTVNKMGEEAGLLILRATPHFLKAAFRDMKMLARYDTTTYAMVLCGSDLGGSVGRAERLREAVSRCVLPLGDDRLRFSVSVSIAETLVGDNVAQLLMHAEAALDAAIESGGNCTYFYNGQWSENAHTMLENIG